MIRFGLIGAGVAAETCARELGHVSGAQLVSVFARDANKAAAFAAAYGCPDATSDLDAFLAGDFDAVVITTPNGLHRDYAVAAAAAGKHVVVEKPIEINRPRAQAIVDACRAAGRRLFVIYQRRHSLAAAQAVDDVRWGRLGKVVLVNIVDNEYRQPEYYSRDAWRGTTQFEGGGCLMTQSTHMIDLAQYILGPLRSVTARIATNFHAIETEDTAVALLDFESGVLGTLSSSTAAWPGQRHILTISGTRGSIILNAEHDQIIFRRVQGEEATTDVPPGFSFADPTNPRDYPTLRQRAQYQAITDALAQGETGVAGADDVLGAVDALDAIYHSARTGEPALLRGPEFLRDSIDLPRE